MRFIIPVDKQTSAQTMLIPIEPQNKLMKLVVGCIPISVKANHQDHKGESTTKQC